jgi:hypothetical protein
VAELHTPTANTLRIRIRPVQGSPITKNNRRGNMRAAMEEVTAKRGREILRTQVTQHLGITLGEFLHNLNTGLYANTDDDTLIKLILLTPFARRTTTGTANDNPPNE